MAPANVRVIVRIRPPNASELQNSENGEENIINLFDSNENNGNCKGRTLSIRKSFEKEYFLSQKSRRTRQRGRSNGCSSGHGSGYGSGYYSDSGDIEFKNFEFDSVLGPKSTQADVFEQTEGIVKAVVGGYNGTIVAYGQTGSGKTHTVFGGNDSSSIGLVHRSLRTMFQKITLSKAESVQQVEDLDDQNVTTVTSCKTTATASFFEIYNEKVYDLLSDKSENLNSSLAIREDAKKGVYVEDLKEVEVEKTSDAEAILQKGMKNRQVAATAMNRISSRSHAIFMIKIKAVMSSANGATKVRNSKFTLVDLAGSERQRSTEATGERLKEATMINKSLLCLGSVINALAINESGKGRHIPFRDSKLTFLLRDSFGGNSKTCLVATVSPAFSSINETVSTLKFAQGAKLIKNTAVLNEDTCVSIGSLKAEITRLKQQLQNCTAPNNAMLESSRKRRNTSSDQVEENSKRVRSSMVALPPLPPSFNRKATFYESDLDSFAEEDSVCSNTIMSCSSNTPYSNCKKNEMLTEARKQLQYAEMKSETLEKQLIRERKLVKLLEEKRQKEKMILKLKEASIERLKRKAGGGVVNNNEETIHLYHEIDCLRRIIEAPSSDAIKWKINYDLVKKKMESMEESCNSLKVNEFEKMQGELKQEIENSLSMKRKLEESCSKTFSLQNRVKELLSIVAVNKEDVKYFEEEIMALEKENKSIRQEHKVEKNMSKELTLHIENLSAERTALADEFVLAQEKEKRLFETVEKQKKEIKKLESKINSLNDELHEKSERFDEIMIELEKSKDENMELTQRVNVSIRQMEKNISEYEELQMKLSNVEKEKNITQKKFSDASTELQKLKANLDATKEMVKNDEEKIEIGSDVIREESGKIEDELRRKVSKLERENEIFKMKNIALEQNLTELNVNADREKREIEENIIKLEQECHEKNQSISEVKEELSNLMIKAELEKKEITQRFEKEIRSLLESNHDAHEKISRWKSAAAEEKRYSRRISNELKVVKKDHDELEFELDAMQEDQDTANGNIRLLAKKNDELKNEISSLKNQLEQMKSDQNNSLNENNEILTKNEDKEMFTPGCTLQKKMNSVLTKINSKNEYFSPDHRGKSTPFRCLENDMNIVLNKISKEHDSEQKVDIEESFDENMFLPNVEMM